MTELLGVVPKTSEQHVDTGAARRKRDNEDSLNFIAWLDKRNPFAYKDEHLHSLSTGVTSIDAKDDVNLDGSLKKNRQQLVDWC